MSGGIAGRGRPGPAGPAGPMGPTGPQGPPAFTLAIGRVSAVPYGQEPEVVNVGTPQDQVWDLALVTGATGVLTGPTPPTATDGTSLGQLYYCTGNRAYYGLVELNENDNKWRLLSMTQESSIHKLSTDIAWQKSTRAEKPTNIGHITYVFDDVRRVLSVGVYERVTQEIGNSIYFMGVDRAVMEEVKALATARGISTVPVPMHKTINGVDTQDNANLMWESWPFPLAEVSSPGTGTKPGYHVSWDNGELRVKQNPTGAPGASTYGDEPYDSLMSSEWSSGFHKAEADATYVVTWSMSAAVVIPYGN